MAFCLEINYENIADFILLLESQMRISIGKAQKSPSEKKKTLRIFYQIFIFSLTYSAKELPPSLPLSLLLPPIFFPSFLF